MKSSLTLATQATLSLFYCHARRALRDEKASNDIRRLLVLNPEERASNHFHLRADPHKQKAVYLKQQLCQVLYSGQILQGPLGQSAAGESRILLKIRISSTSVQNTLEIEGKADRTAKGYKFICPIFRLNKTSLYQGLEKLSEDRKNGYTI